MNSFTIDNGMSSMFESKIAVAGGLAGSIRFLNLSSGACIHLIDEANEGLAEQRLPHINKLVHHDGALIACGNPWVRTYDLRSINSPPTVYEGHSGNVTCAAIHQDSKWFITGGEDGGVRVWDLRAQGYQVGVTHSAPINCGKLHPNQGVFVFGDSEGFLNEWDLGANCIVRTPLTDPKTSQNVGLGVTCVNVLYSEDFVVAHGNNSISILGGTNTDPKDRDEYLSAPPPVFDDASPTHALSPPSPPPLAPLISRGVSLLRLTSPAIAVEPDVIQRSAVPNLITTFGDDVHPKSYITSATMAGDSRVAVTSSDGSVSLWNKQEETDDWALDCIMGTSHAHSHGDNWSWDACFLPDENHRYIVAAYDDGKCKLMDSSRPTRAPVAVYDAGGGKCVKSILILDNDVVSRENLGSLN